MSTSMNALAIRNRLGRKLWSPPEPFGPDGWRFKSWGLPSSDETPSDSPHQLVGEILVTCSDMPPECLPEGMPNAEWLHASIVRPWMPSHEDLTLLHRAVFADGYAYQVFAPPSEHVNIHERALHLWGRLDGKAVLPEFGKLGTI